MIDVSANAAAPAEAEAPMPMKFPPEVRTSVQVFEGCRGRGLQCTRRVEAGEPLIGIPRQWAISTNKASRSGGSSGQVALARELVRLRRAGDFRAGHLPDGNDMPCFWTAQQLALLEPSHAHEPASNQRRTLEQIYQSERPKNCTVEEFVWAMGMVQSRTFGGGSEMVILPFIDLINTEAAPDLGFDLRRSKDGYITVHASRAFEAGEEALVSYHGKDKPPELFSNFFAYGFVPETGVTYPNLWPWDERTGVDALSALLTTLQAHVKAIAASPAFAEASTLEDEDMLRRRAIARQLLTHERSMALEQAVRVKRRLVSLESS